MITSPQNPKIKWVRSLQASSRERKESGAFVVEGVRLAGEALAAGWPVLLVLYTEDLSERGRRLLQRFAENGAPLEAVTPQVLHAASDTQTPQGILVVISQHIFKIPQGLDFVFIPDGVRDPGNLGTMLRTAAAAGVQALILPPGAVDPFAPKVLRSAMGAHFRLPVLSLSWPEISTMLKKADLQIYLAEVGAGTTYYQANFDTPLALITGGEAEGASQEAHDLATTQVYIPMPGGMESLNAAVAAGILLFEVVRQRNRDGK